MSLYNSKEILEAFNDFVESWNENVHFLEEINPYMFENPKRIERLRNIINAMDKFLDEEDSYNDSITNVLSDIVMKDEIAKMKKLGFKFGSHDDVAPKSDGIVINGFSVSESDGKVNMSCNGVDAIINLKNGSMKGKGSRKYKQEIHDTFLEYKKKYIFS